MPRLMAARRALLAVAALMALTLFAGFAQETLADDDDHEGMPPNAASVDAALATTQRAYPGRVLKIELERDDDDRGRWVYEVKVLTASGRVVEVKLDAASLELLRVEGGRSGHSDDD